MASYFDLPPQKAATPATIEQLPPDQRKQLGRTNSLMTPAVTQILEGLADDHSDSSSSEEDGSISEDEEPALQQAKDISAQKVQQNKQKHNSVQAPRPSSLSPNRTHSKSTKNSSGQSTSTASASGDGSDRPKSKQPHMARFHSLRSMLFQQKIEDRMKTVAQGNQETSAAEKWRTQHEERQMHHPITPEKDTQAKNGIGSRLKMTIRRMTTKDAGGMEKIREDGTPVEFKDRTSDASSENVEKHHSVSKKVDENDDDSINDSDIEDLVRWASRRGPPSDGAAQKDDTVEDAKEDSGHESLGNSDVEELVHYARKKSDAQDAAKASDEYLGYSDASTESDTEPSSDEEEDAEDLVRWISHREGPKAGPVRQNLERPELDSDIEAHYDSDVPELGRWFKRYDATSGESIATNSIVKDKSEQQQIEEEEATRGRPRSRDLDEPPAVAEKTHVTHDDIDELVRWVSRKDLARQDTPISGTQDPVKSAESEADEKKKAVGMSVDQGSLSHSDVQDLIEHVRKTSVNVEGDNKDPDGVERSDWKQTQDENTLPGQDSQQELAGKVEDIQRREKEGQLGMSVEDGSLSHGDIEGLLAHVRKS